MSSILQADVNLFALCAPQVVGRLDMVDPTMLSFFQPAAEKVMSSADPAKAMAAALAALSGIKEIPKPRSLLAQVPHLGGSPWTFDPDSLPSNAASQLQMACRSFFDVCCVRSADGAILLVSGAASAPTESVISFH